MTCWRMSWFCGIDFENSICDENLSSASVIDERLVELIRRNRLIEEQIARDRDYAKDTMKILLLGGPESGKSTIFKQMRILHMNGFSDTDIINYRFLVYRNVIQAMHKLLLDTKLLNIDIDLTIQPEVEKFMAYVQKTAQNEYEISPELGLAIQYIYEASFMEQVLSRQHEINLMDSATYFLNNIQRIAEVDYAPSIQDILRSRLQTTGIVEVEFKYKKFNMRMVDVGGQKSEQRKWIYCFDNVHGVLFVADISGYMQFIEEKGEKINRLKYNLRLFTFVIRNRYFANSTAFLLFFNKVDLFKERCENYPLTMCFKTYKEKNTYDSMTNYIKGRFLQADTRDNVMKNPIYTHFTNATDTNNIDRVFNNCIEAMTKIFMNTVALT